MAIANCGMRSGNTIVPRPALGKRLQAWFRVAFMRGVTRFGGGRGERRMELVETLQLGGKRQLLLVNCEGQRYLVGAGGDSVQSIVEMRFQSAAPNPPQANDTLLRGQPAPVILEVERDTGCIQ